jgi:2-dehydro-3-deoxyphosphogalactonate aldolase
MTDFDRAFSDCPLIAILRGITPEECEAVAAVLVDEGFRIIEVPLNSPEPVQSIRRLAQKFGTTALIGAGTVMTAGDCAQVAEAGGRLIVMPHADTELIAAAKAARLTCAPGVATPTEAFAALRAGADALKLFPAEALPPPVIRAWRAVLPPSVRLIPVGGIGTHNMRGYHEAGADGFGIGSTLYKPGKPAAEVKKSARLLIEAWDACQPVPVRSA